MMPASCRFLSILFFYLSVVYSLALTDNKVDEEDLAPVPERELIKGHLSGFGLSGSSNDVHALLHTSGLTTLHAPITSDGSFEFHVRRPCKSHYSIEIVGTTMAYSKLKLELRPDCTIYKVHYPWAPDIVTIMDSGRISKSTTNENSDSDSKPDDYSSRRHESSSVKASATTSGSSSTGNTDSRRMNRSKNDKQRLLSKSGWLLPEPLGFVSYFQERPSFNIVAFIKQPMVLVMIFGVLTVFVFPKFMDGIDEDLMKEVSGASSRIVPDSSKLFSQVSGLQTLDAMGNRPELRPG